MTIESRNPATGELHRRFDAIAAPAVERAVEAAVDGHRRLRELAFADRSALMHCVAELLEASVDAHARLLTEEMGKTLAAARAEVEKCARVCRYYADHAAAHLADRAVDAGYGRSFVRCLPLGPVLAVMPWNFPFWQVFRFAAPALMAGNAGLLKHASNVPRCALAIEALFREAGFPPGAFRTLLIDAGQVEAVLGDARVRAVTLTGSEQAGATVASQAGRHIKKTVLELGGSDAFVVMPSANLEEAVDVAVRARTLNNGQSCIAAKRFIVHRDVYDRFREAFVAAFEALRVGDPTRPETDVGPLATEAVREDLDTQVEASLRRGARRLTGAARIPGAGFFYQPGILEDIPEDAPAFSEELFGPVALLFRAADLDAALRLANASRFGLGSAIFTRDEREVERAVNELEAGSTFVNAMVASDPRLPFGGVKASGYGRELSAEGIREFVNVKTIAIA